MGDWLKTWEWGWVRVVEDRDTIFANYLRDDDLVMISADHGNDPSP